MMKWWLDREPREKWLISIAGAMFVLLITWQFVVMPIGRAHVSANDRVQEAERNLQIVEQAVPVLSAGPVRTGQPFSRAVLVQRAAAGNVSLQRVQPGKAGELEFWVEGAATNELFDLLHKLTSENGAQLLQVHISRNDAQGVNARIRIKAS